MLRMLLCHNCVVVAIYHSKVLAFELRHLDKIQVFKAAVSAHEKELASSEQGSDSKSVGRQATVDPQQQQLQSPFLNSTTPFQTKDVQALPAAANVPSAPSESVKAETAQQRIKPTEEIPPASTAEKRSSGGFSAPSASKGKADSSFADKTAKPQLEGRRIDGKTCEARSGR